jgi:hypothetical protein
MRPAAVEESMPSVVEINVMLRSVKALTVSRTWRVLRPSRSSFHHDGVALSNVFEERCQAWTVVPGTRHGVGEGLCDTSSGESGVLLL